VEILETHRRVFRAGFATGFGAHNSFQLVLAFGLDFRTLPTPTKEPEALRFSRCVTSSPAPAAWQAADSCSTAVSPFASLTGPAPVD
jgi:hypothetical protein